MGVIKGGPAFREEMESARGRRGGAGKAARSEAEVLPDGSGTVPPPNVGKQRKARTGEVAPMRAAPWDPSAPPTGSRRRTCTDRDSTSFPARYFEEEKSDGNDHVRNGEDKDDECGEEAA